MDENLLSKEKVTPFFTESEGLTAIFPHLEKRLEKIVNNQVQVCTFNWYIVIFKLYYAINL